MRVISFKDAERVYQILVEHVGARDDEDEVRAFAHHVSKDRLPCDEYRFQGSLGFGGKFRNNGNRENTPYVDCYPEDETPERLAAIGRANAALAEWFAAPAPPAFPFVR